MSHICIVEAGGQQTDLIGNRFSQMGFAVKYVPHTTQMKDVQDAAGIIISGGPKSVNAPDAYNFDPDILTTRTPFLGICYGMQWMGKDHGADIHGRTKEYGETVMKRQNANDRDRILYGHGEESIVWMNHGDSVARNEEFDVLASTEKGVPAVIRSKRGPYYGVQYHPELTHTERGEQLLRNFAEGVCGLSPEKREVAGFDAGRFAEEAIRRLKDEVGSREAVVYTSGGVDSSVAAALAKRAGVKLHLVYLEMGNGRNGEAQFVSEKLGKALNLGVYVHDKAQQFVDALQGISEPEQKRKRFAALYGATQQELNEKFGLIDGSAMLIQGTIATDERESGREAGKKSATDSGTVAKIKTHHNVGAEVKNSVTPLNQITKEMVRQIAREIGLPEEIVSRQPFPGPGLYVRYVTDIYEPSEELKTHVAKTAQKFGLRGVVLPRRSVGLMGDGRVYKHTALVAGDREWANVRRAGKAMIEDLEICRVLYLPEARNIQQDTFDIAGNYPMTAQNLERLREVTETVEATMLAHGVRASQVPVAMFGGPHTWIHVIRDVDSQDFRSCRPLRKPDEFPWECYDEIVKRLAQSGLYGYTVLDVSDKPGGTTEWE